MPAVRAHDAVAVGQHAADPDLCGLLADGQVHSSADHAEALEVIAVGHHRLVGRSGAAGLGLEVRIATIVVELVQRLLEEPHPNHLPEQPLA